MRQCKVYIHGIYAGLLTETDPPREYLFQYDKKYIDNNKEPVSLTMPIRKEVYTSPILFPYFFNILSEGENREIQSQLLHIDQRDDFGILLETAQTDTPGAVTVRPITVTNNKE